MRALDGPAFEAGAWLAAGTGTAAWLLALTVIVTIWVIICGSGVTVTVGAAPLPNTVDVKNDNCVGLFESKYRPL